jgi:hypothetical protein
VRKYIEKYILSTRSFDEYLEKAVGTTRLTEIKADPVLGY